MVASYRNGRVGVETGDCRADIKYNVLGAYVLIAAQLRVPHKSL